jgi:hypothetical protein
MTLDEIVYTFGAIYSFGITGHSAISTRAQLSLHRFVMMNRLNFEVVHAGKLRSLIYLLQRDRHAQAAALNPTMQRVSVIFIFEQLSILPEILMFQSCWIVPGIRIAEYDPPSWVPLLGSSLL